MKGKDGYSGPEDDKEGKRYRKGLTELNRNGGVVNPHSC